MANTDVKLVPSEGTFVPSIQNVNVVAGDTVTLHNGGGGPAFLFFSPDALRLLSLKPGEPPTIPGGGQAVYTFASSAPGVYMVYFGGGSEMAPQGFPGQADTKFLLLPASGLLPGFQANPLSSGH